MLIISQPTKKKWSQEAMPQKTQESFFCLFWCELNLLFEGPFGYVQKAYKK